MVKLTPDDQFYLRTLYRQFKNPRKLKLKIGKNFFPSALLTPSQCKSILGVTDYRSLKKNKKEYERAARCTILILNPMNGGIGTSIERRNYLRRIWKILGKKGKVMLGAKGCDLYFDVKTSHGKRKISISEAKILRALKEQSKYKKTVIQYLVSTATIKSVRSLLNKFPLLKRKAFNIFPARGTLTRKLILLPPLIQEAFPTIDEKGKWNWRRKAPGGHGQWLSILLKNALDSFWKMEKQPIVSAIYNEDGLNNTIEPMIVGWMVKEKIPCVMISTTKTSLDRKGGLLGLARIGGRWKKEILEFAQAESCGQASLLSPSRNQHDATGGGQEKLFLKMGIGLGRKAGQYFNTNTILLNYTIILPLLKKLLDQKSREHLIEMTAPDLIQNRKKQKEGAKMREYIQLEGALGSALLNLDNYFLLNGNEKKFLKILNVDEKMRYRFFTPIKNAFDFWIQFYSDLFAVNTSKWSLEYRGKGMLPKVVLSSYYEDIEHVLNAFGTEENSLGAVSLKQLKELEIQGKVRLAGAQLSGKVRILNESSALIDLNHPEFRKHFPTDARGRLVLKNQFIRIARNRKLRISSFSNKR